MVEAAARIRSERLAIAEREAFAAFARAGYSARPRRYAPIRVRRRLDTGERHRASDLRERLRWSWMRPARRYDEYRDLLAAAEEQLAEQRSAELSRPAARRAE